jgi:hypothetical protein
MAMSEFVEFSFFDAFEIRNLASFIADLISFYFPLHTTP